MYPTDLRKELVKRGITFTHVWKKLRRAKVPVTYGTFVSYLWGRTDPPIHVWARIEPLVKEFVK